MERQTRFVLENIKRTLEDNGSDLAHVVKTQVFLTDSALFADFDRVWQEFFPVPPPRTTVEVGPIGLLVPGTLVEIDVIAVPVDGSAELEQVGSDRVPTPLANYTPCTRYGDWLFLAGQLASDFGPDGVPFEAKVNPDYPYYGSDIERQTEYTLRNLQALLEDAGSDLEHVVKAQVFLKDLNDFNGFDDVWKRFFPEFPPPRTTLQVAELLVPGSKLEIDLIAVRKDGATQIERISSPDAPHPLANYTQAVKVGDVVFLAGQLASDFTNGVAPEAKVDPNFRFYGSDIEKQTDYTLKNCQTVLAAAGSSLNRTVKAQVFMTDLRKFSGMDKVWKRHFEPVPPRTTVELAGDGLLVPGTLVEIDLIAVAE
jgi:enamine deaminase RidA (YjgF/YER057c/UK114 family)